MNKKKQIKKATPLNLNKSDQMWVSATKYIPGGFFGEDREGHPVWHSNMGNLDIRGEGNTHHSYIHVEEV